MTAVPNTAFTLTPTTGPLAANNRAYGPYLFNGETFAAYTTTIPTADTR